MPRIPRADIERLKQTISVARLAEAGGIELNYYRARYYSPRLNRFIQSIPVGLGGGINTYTYVYNDPVSYVDLEGKIAWGVGFAALDIGLQLYRNNGTGAASTLRKWA